MSLFFFDDEPEYNEHQIAWLTKDWSAVQKCADQFKESPESEFFGLIGAINDTKQQINVSQMDYSKFMIENALSQHADCMPAVYVMNLVGQGLSDQAHFNYMKHAVPKGKRYGKWAKLTEDSNKMLVLKVIQAFYQINVYDADMYHKTMFAKGNLLSFLKQAKALVTDEMVKSITKNVKEQKQLKKQALEW